VIRFLARTVVSGGLILLMAGWAGTAPPPPLAKFWTASQCKQVLLAHDHALPTAEGYFFHAGLTICVGTGGPGACTWTSDHRSRLYSQFTVFTRARYIGSIVRSFTIATRPGNGLIRMGHHAGDHYARYRTDFYASPASVRLVATNATPSRFRTTVAPLAARLTQQENATSCTSG
jgi:hypothetical protein